MYSGNRCNGYFSCADGSDEFNCSKSTQANFETSVADRTIIIMI